MDDAYDPIYVHPDRRALCSATPVSSIDRDVTAGKRGNMSTTKNVIVIHQYDR